MNLLKSNAELSVGEQCQPVSLFSFFFLDDRFDFPALIVVTCAEGSVRSAAENLNT